MPSRYDTLILDLDGTVHIDGEPIGDVVADLNALADRGVRRIFLTNNTSTGLRDHRESLLQMGISLANASIISPTGVAAQFFLEHFGVTSAGFVVGTSSFRSELADYGIHSSYLEPQYVLLSFDREVTYRKLEVACTLVNSGVPYFLTNIDRCCPTMSGPIPDCGAIGQLVEVTTGIVNSGHFGKPGPLLARHLRSHIVGSALLAGDRLYTDIALGHQLEVDTLLVLSGEASGPETDDHPKATFMSSTLSEFLRWL